MLHETVTSTSVMCGTPNEIYEQLVSDFITVIHEHIAKRPAGDVQTLFCVSQAVLNYAQLPNILQTYLRDEGVPQPFTLLVVDENVIVLSWAPKVEPYFLLGVEALVNRTQKIRFFERSEVEALPPA